MSDKDNKPVLDEQTFEKLLEAAYVLQEHNRKMRELERSLESQSELRRKQELAEQSAARINPKASAGAQSNSDYTLTLSQIVEAQHQIQMHHLGLDQAMGVVAERVAQITNASGAAIGILDGKMVRYRAGRGKPALPVGSERPLDSAICVASVRTGKVIRSEDVNAEFLFDPELCRQRGILSLLSVPIYHDGDIVGALELYFDRIRGFAEQDTHTCQLMAGLVTEAISREAESTLKNSIAVERSSMLAAIEKLIPNAASVAAGNAAAEHEAAEHRAAARTRVRSTSESEVLCSKCGGSLLAEEQFCGECGAPRANRDDAQTVQATVLSQFPNLHGGLDPITSTANGSAPGNLSHPPANSGEDLRDAPEQRARFDADDFLQRSFAELSLADPSLAEPVDDDAITASLRDCAEENVGEDESIALVVPQQEEVVWSSAAKARNFLESISGKREPGAFALYWRSRRGDFYLGLAVILVVVVIRWGIWSENSAGAAGSGTTIAASHRKHFDANANLSTFDKFLIWAGLAEAPDPPEYRGNPNTQVWVDLHTALYYCPGSELYGKTPKGKTTSQRDAQLDQFEPASRKVCD